MIKNAQTEGTETMSNTETINEINEAITDAEYAKTDPAATSYMIAECDAFLADCHRAIDKLSA